MAQPVPVPQVIQQVISNSLAFDGNHATLFKHEPDPNSRLPWMVHVDLSASMKGFVNPGSSAFKVFLERLNQQLPGVQFTAEGSTNSQLTAVPSDFPDFLKPEFYLRSGTDYAQLFRQFVLKTNFNHIFITDGVLFQNGHELKPSAVTGPLRELLSNGGDFSLLAQRSAFDGEYTSMRRLKDSPVGTPSQEMMVTITTNARPFLVWIFAQRDQSLPALWARISRGMGGADEWDSLLPDIRPRHAATLTKYDLAPDGSDGRRVIASLETLSADQFNAISFGKIFGQRPVPFNFDIYVPARTVGTNIKSDVEAAVQEARTNLTASLACWSVVSTNGPTKARNARLVPLRIPPGPPLQLKTVSPEQIDGDLIKARLILPTARPEQAGQYQAWLLTITSLLGPTWRSKWAQVSTDNDTSPVDGGRIYNLSAVLEAIQKDCLVVDRTVFVTYWP